MKYLYLSLIAFALLLISVSAVAQNEDAYSMEQLKEKYKPLEDETEIADLCRDFMANASDIDVVRTAQNYWEGVDEDGVRAYCDEIGMASPTARNKYLCGRIAKTPVEKIKLGRDAILQEPDWPYGYRLVLATYANDLFNGDTEDEHYATLKGMLADDASAFETFSKVDPTEIYAFQVLAQYQIYQNDYSSALATMEKAKTLEKPWWPASKHFAQVYAGLGRFDDALTTITDEANLNKWEENEEERRAEYINSSYSSALRTAKAYEQLISHLKETDGWDSNQSTLYDLACTAALLGNNDQAMEFLSQATKFGWDQVGHTKTDSDLEPLYSNPRWETVMVSVQTNWDKGAPKRKEEALAGKIDEVAPNWSLPDVNGNMVSLSDLKGKVLVLDFWATWCGPCRMAMPVIDEFTKTKAGDDVIVFSVDIWEKGKKKPAQYLKEHDYAMTLLYGNDDLAKEFGVRGIPFLCVIDQDGHIRYKETGYSESLGENLVYWTEDLLGVESR